MSLNPTTLFLCLLASVSGWSSLATLAAAADSVMEWQFYESNDPDNKGRMTARLVYGVPETDNVGAFTDLEVGLGLRGAAAEQDGAARDENNNASGLRHCVPPVGRSLTRDPAGTTRPR